MVPPRTFLNAVCRAIGFALILFGAAIDQATAQSCSASMGALNFGSVDVTTNATYTTTSTLTINCTGSGGATVRTCIGFGGGSGGIASSGAPRYMANGSNSLAFQIYTDPARTTVWGSAWTGGAGTWREASVTLNTSGVGSTAVTAYGLVFAGQQSVASGSYTSSFSAADVNLQATYAATGCGSFFTPPTFSVIATVAKNCAVTATNLNFGSVGVLNGPKDGSSTITVTCLSGVAYNVGLSAGSGTGATVAARKMTGAGGATVSYSLYKDATHGSVWGETVGVDALGGTGVGAAQNLTVYGRAPAQATPQPGVYSDTIVVTVTY
jgi:spore coat protein U-like protein